MKQQFAYWTGWTNQPPHPPLCGCETVLICYGVYRGPFGGRDLVDAVSWCPRCEATWTGLEYRRFYGVEE